MDAMKMTALQADQLIGAIRSLDTTLSCIMFILIGTNLILFGISIWRGR